MASACSGQIPDDNNVANLDASVTSIEVTAECHRFWQTQDVVDLVAEEAHAEEKYAGTYIHREPKSAMRIFRLVNRIFAKAGERTLYRQCAVRGVLERDQWKRLVQFSRSTLARLTQTLLIFWWHRRSIARANRRPYFSATYVLRST